MYSICIIQKKISGGVGETWQGNSGKYNRIRTFKKQFNFKTLENMPFCILPERCRIHPSLTKLKNGAEGIKIWLTKNPLIESIHQAKIQLRWPLKAIICWSENRILLFADISSSQKNARLFFYEFNFKCWPIVQVCICTFLIAIQSFIFKQI